MSDGSPGPSAAEIGLSDKDLGMISEKPPKTASSDNQTPQSSIPLKPQPQFLREFSRAGSPEERSALAAQIKEKRSEYFGAKTEKSGKETRLEQGLKELAALEAAIQDIPDSWFGRLMNRRKLEELRTKYGSQEEINQQIRNELSQMAITERRLSSDGLPVTRLDQVRDMVNKFYEREKVKWANSEYTKEDVQRLFSEEHLSSLSIEDFILLLRRFPSDMLVHVTRQGIRDHIGLEEHSQGEGKFNNGAKNIFAAGRIRSMLGIFTKDGITKEAYLNMLEYLTVNSGDPDIARSIIQVLIDDRNYPNPYANRSAVHLSVGTVADRFYGAEGGNEIFFAFPTAFIAAHNFYGGNSKLSEEHVGKMGFESAWNDVSVWTDGDIGLSINAGLVFIPADAQVDQVTGSKYALDENNQPIKIAGADGEETYQLAADTISSQEYWEKYFTIHPEQRPKRVIYYEGGDPTRALNEWRIDNGLVKKSDDNNFGFPEREVKNPSDPIANQGKERFRSLAEQALDSFNERHPQKKAA